MDNIDDISNELLYKRHINRMFKVWIKRMLELNIKQIDGQGLNLQHICIMLLQASEIISVEQLELHKISVKLYEIMWFAPTAQNELSFCEFATNSETFQLCFDKLKNLLKNIQSIKKHQHAHVVQAKYQTTNTGNFQVLLLSSLLTQLIYMMIYSHTKLLQPQMTQIQTYYSISNIYDVALELFPFIYLACFQTKTSDNIFDTNIKITQLMKKLQELRLHEMCANSKHTISEFQIFDLTQLQDLNYAKKIQDCLTNILESLRNLSQSPKKDMQEVILTFANIIAGFQRKLQKLQITVVQLLYVIIYNQHDIHEKTKYQILQETLLEFIQAVFCLHYTPSSPEDTQMQAQQLLHLKIQLVDKFFMYTF